MPLLQQILPAVLVALAVSMGICALALQWSGRAARAVLAPCALGFGYICGHLMATGWTAFPPVDTINWLPYFALAATLLGILHQAPGPPVWARMLVFALFAAGALTLLLQPRLQGGPGEGVLWVGCLAAGTVALAAVCDALCQPLPVAMPLFLLIPCAGTVIALMISGSLLLGELAAVLAATVSGSFVLSLRQVPPGRGVAPVFATLFSALLVSGCFFAELPALSALLLAVAPALALVRTGRLPVLWAVAIRVLLVAIPVGIALAIAFRASPPLEY